MTEKIETLEDIDAKIIEQQERMKEEEQEKKETEGQLTEEQVKERLPFTYKMEQIFKENIKKAQKCLACNWQNYGQILLMMNYIEIMGEQLPIPTFICQQCGGLFVPKWARRIMKQAVDQENKIIKQGVRIGAETGV